MSGRTAPAEVKIAAIGAASEVTVQFLSKVSADWFITRGDNTTNEEAMRASGELLGSLTGLIARNLLDNLYRE